MNSHVLRSLQGCCFIALLVCSAPSPTLAAEGKRPVAPAATAPASVQQMSLEAVVAEVLEHNPEVNFYNTEIAAARGEARTAAQWINPEFSTSIGSKRVTGGSLAQEGVAWSVSIRQTFEWPGRIPLRKAIANQQRALAELGFAQFKAALAVHTRIAAFALFAAQQKTEAAQEVANRFHTLREVLVQRDVAGVTPELELRILEATEITLLRKVSEAAVAEQTATLELNQLRGQPWQREIAITPVDLTFTAAPEPHALLVAAQRNNFELRMRQVELAQQGFKVSLAQKDQYPSFTVGPYFSQERAGDHERQIGLGLEIPLPLWNRNEGSIETALARQQQAETSLLVAHRAIEKRVMETALIYKTKLTEMAKWRPESVPEFRKAAALADRHYRLGAVPLSIYVELQKQYLDAVEALVDTKREALDAGQHLELLTGLDIHAVRTTP